MSTRKADSPESIAKMMEELGIIPPKQWDRYSKVAKLDYIATRILAMSRTTTSHTAMRDEGILSISQYERRLSREVFCQPAGTEVLTSRRVSGYRHASTKNHGGYHYELLGVPIETLQVGDRVATWKRRPSGQGTPSTLNKVGCAVDGVVHVPYDGPLIEVTVDGCVSRYTPEHHCEVLLTGSSVGNQVVYLMRRGGQYRIGMTAWRYESSTKKWGPLGRCDSEGGDAFWVLDVFDTVPEAALAEAMVGHRFGIPTWRFTNAGRYEGRGVNLDTFWAKVGDNREAAARCLAEYGRLIDCPLWERGNDRHAGFRPITIAAANLMDGMRMLAIHNGTTPWRTYDTAYTRRNPKRDTVVTGQRSWTPATTRRTWYSGDVISISVEKDHTYIADGIVTHNSSRGSLDEIPPTRGVFGRIHIKRSRPKGRVDEQ